MSRIKYRLAIIFAVLLVFAGGFYIYRSHYAPLKPENETEISVWYVNDDALWQKFSRTVNEYNSGEGAEYGITVKLKEFSNQADMYEKISTAIENGDKLPEITICDTDFAAYMNKKGVLADMDSYFDSWETAALDKDMLSESYCKGELCAYPIASETNVFMINTDLFSDSAAITSFERLCSVADEYYGRKGNSFFAISDYSLFFRTAAAQLDDEFDAQSPHESDNNNSKYIYKLLAESAYNRGFTSIEKAPAKQVGDGKLACAIISSADIMQYEDYIDADSIEFFGYPCMKKGSDVYVDKVTGAAISKCETDAEHSAVMFLRWFTSEDVNTRFVGNSGYLPASIAEESDYENESDSIYPELMEAVSKQKNSGKVCTYSADAGYSENSREFDSVMQTIMGSLN